MMRLRRLSGDEMSVMSGRLGGSVSEHERRMQR